MLEFLLALSPLLLLLVALCFGRYPGVEAILRLTTRNAPMARLRAAGSQCSRREPVSHLVRGGLLLAFGFARRPPPLAPQIR
jgi:hypothetical protein